MLPKFSIFLLFLVLLGCEDSTSSLQDERHLSYELTDSALQVQNKLRTPVYYFVVDANTAATINWAPLSKEENKIASRGEANIPLEDILGYEKGNRLIFYYWWEKQSEGKEIMNFSVETGSSG